MKIYIKSIASQSHMEYAWFRVKKEGLERMNGSINGLDEALSFYYNGTGSRMIFYCSALDQERRDGWDRPVTDKLYISASVIEREELEALAAQWMCSRESFLADFYAAFKSQQGSLTFCTDWLHCQPKGFRSLTVAHDLMLPVFIDESQIDAIFTASAGGQGKHVRICAADSFSPVMARGDSVCITHKKESLESSYKEYKGKKRKKATGMVSATVMTFAAVSGCSLYLYKKKKGFNA